MTDDHLKKVSLNSQSRTVREAREKIERDIAEFQQRGGRVEQLPSTAMETKSQNLTGGRAGIYE